MKKNLGFTLIEVLISLAILSTLGILAAQSIRQSIAQKKKIQTQLDDVSQVRDALHLMERDINLAYHHLDWEKELEELVTKKKTGTGQTQQNPQTPGFPPPPNPAAGSQALTDAQALIYKREVPRVDPTTNFVGLHEEIDFVTMNNGRLVRNQKQADFTEVGYSIKDCRTVATQAQTKCLWRRSSPIADTDVTKGGDEVPVVANVTEFSLRYLGPPKQDWVDSWRTDDQSPDSSLKNRFPIAVEITLTVQDTHSSPPGKKYSMQTVATIHYPNNPPLEGASNVTPGP